VKAAAGRGPGVVLVTGAGGALGPPVLRAFAEAGWSVRSLSRSEAVSLGPGNPVDHVQGDVRDEALVRQALRHVDVVVHMAALLHLRDATEERAAEYRDVNVHGTEVVVRAARDAGVARIVFTSSISVYGAEDGLVNEETRPRPDSLYASTKYQAEEVVLNAFSAEGIRMGAVLRLGAVYGPTVKGNYARLVRALARGRFVPLGRGHNRRTVVYEKDVANAILLAASHPAAVGHVFNVTDGSVHTVAAITASICRALGRRPPWFSLPSGLGLAAILPVELVFRALSRRPPVSRQTLEKYLEDVAVSGDAIRKELGFSPEWDLDRGWNETIEAMRLLGRL
jgi:nucleoside-diphosphate-sugar epimerase